MTAISRRWLIAGLCATLAAAPVAAQVISDAGDGGVPAFYRWDGAPPARPGELLRAEALTARQSLPQAGKNIRLLYSSTDGVGGQARGAVSGALYLPHGTPPAGGWPLLAWAHGTVGIADVCAPSFAGRGDRDTRYLDYWLDQGYAIVATDYQGLGTPGAHPYVHVRSEAYSILDSIRAVQKHYPVSARTVLIGQSQGGGAVVATATFAKDYAPELDIAGAVGTGVNLSARDYAAPMNNTKRVAYFLVYLNAIQLVDPAIKPEEYVSDKALPAFELTRTACFPQVEQRARFDHLDKDNSFRQDLSAITRKLAGFKHPPTLHTDIPIFWGTGGKDTDVFPEAQQSGVTTACAAGSRVEWHVYPGFDHSATVNGSLPDSTAFIKRAFAGEKIEGNCAAPPTLPAPGPAS